MSKLVETEKAQVPTIYPGASFDPTDIILPTLSIRQNTYKQEAFKKFRGGDVILRPDNIVVADEEKSFQVIPLSIEKIVKVQEIVGTDAKFVCWEAPDASKPYNFSADGKEYRRDLCFVVYLMSLKQAVEQAKSMTNGDADPDDFALPIRATFTRGGLFAGKVLNTHFERCKMFKSNTWSRVFDLKSAEKSNDKGNWFVFNCEPAIADGKNMKTPKEVWTLADFWTKTLANSKASLRVTPELDDDIVVESASVTPISEANMNF